MYSRPLIMRRASARSGGNSSSTVRVILFVGPGVFFSLVPQWLACFQHVLDAFERLWFTAQRDKRLALEIEKVLLADPLARREIAAAKNVSNFAADVQIVLAHIATLLHNI